MYIGNGFIPRSVYPGPLVLVGIVLKFGSFSTSVFDGLFLLDMATNIKQILSKKIILTTFIKHVHRPVYLGPNVPKESPGVE